MNTNYPPAPPPPDRTNSSTASTPRWPLSTVRSAGVVAESDQHALQHLLIHRVVALVEVQHLDYLLSPLPMMTGLDADSR